MYDKAVTCELRSLDGKRSVFIENMLVTDKLPGRHPKMSPSFKAAHSHLSDLPLDHTDYDNEIHMLIGNDQAHLTKQGACKMQLTT